MALARVKAGELAVTPNNLGIPAAVSLASSGDTVDIQNGSYTLAGELDIAKSLTLAGQSQAGTTITSNSTGYGINVTGDNVTLKNFTYNGPTGTGSTYGIKVQPDTGVASDRVLNFGINHVTINGGYRTGLDLNGVVGGTIDNVSVSNIVHGNGIALTDSANVTLTNNTTANNDWGGLALYQHNNYYDQQLTNITVAASNNFTEANGIYAEDESDGIADPDHGPSVANYDFGTLNIAGYSYIAIDFSNSADQYAYLQKTQQGAVDFATDSTANHGHLGLGTTFVEGWAGSSPDNVFTVGYNTGHTAHLSINAAAQAASDGATINVGAGVYREQVIIDSDGLTLTGAGAGNTVIESPDTLAFGLPTPGGLRKSIVAVNQANGVKISGLTVDGRGQGDVNAYFVGIGSLNADNLTIDNVHVTRVRNGGEAGSLNGGQSGVGVGVFNDGAVARTVTVENSSFDDIQKNAIMFLGGNVTANVLNNTITGAGTTGAIAQNGIEFYGENGHAVSGAIKGNTVSGYSYDGASTSTGIILIGFQGVTVQDNTVTGDGTNGSSTGLYATAGSNLTIKNNTFQNLETGVDVEGDDSPTGGGLAPVDNVTVIGGVITGDQTASSPTPRPPT